MGTDEVVVQSNHERVEQYRLGGELPVLEEQKVNYGEPATRFFKASDDRLYVLEVTDGLPFLMPGITVIRMFAMANFFRSRARP